MTGAFHWRDGWHFERTEEGAVNVFRQRKIQDVPEPVMTIDPNSWASIVASVSAGGETGESYRAALAFHNAEQPEKE